MYSVLFVSLADVTILATNYGILIDLKEIMHCEVIHTYNV